MQVAGRSAQICAARERRKLRVVLGWAGRRERGWGGGRVPARGAVEIRSGHAGRIGQPWFRVIGGLAIWPVSWRWTARDRRARTTQGGAHGMRLFGG